MKRVSILILIIISLFCGVTTLSGLEYFRINFKGQSKNLRNLYKSLNLSKDEVIVYFIYPNAAPRLEFLINESYNYIKNLNYTGNIIGIINFPKYWYAKDYIQKMAFPFKCVIDTNFDFFTELTSMNPMVPPLLVKFDKEGNLKNQISLYGITNLSQVITSFLKEVDTNNRKPEEWIPKNGFEKNDFLTYPVLKPEIFLEINEDPINFLDLIISLKVDPKEKYLFLNGRGSYRWSIYRYKTSTDKERFEIEPELYIRKYFSSDIDSSKFLELEKNYSYAKSMLMDGFFEGDSIFIILSVLPQISFEISKSDTIYYASTRYAFLHFNYYTNKIQRIVPINLERIPNYFAVAPYTQLSSINSKTKEVALTLYKGYPTVGFNKPVDTSFYLNPITPSFYDFAPLFCSFNYETGEFIRYYGKVGMSHGKLGTGYFMCMPLIAFDQRGKYYIAQNLSDFVETDSTVLKIKSYFEESLLVQHLKPVDSLPDISFYYLISDSNKARILDIIAYKKNLILLWRLKEKNKTINESELMLLQIYNIENKTLEKELVLPYTYRGSKFSTHFFNPQKSELYALYYNSRQTLVVKYELP